MLLVFRLFLYWSGVPSSKRVRARSRNCWIVPDVSIWREIKYCCNEPQGILAILFASSSFVSLWNFVVVLVDGVEHVPVTWMLPGVDGNNVFGINDLACWNGRLSVNGPRDTSNPRCTVLSLEISFKISYEHAWDVILSPDKTEETRSLPLWRIS